VRRLISAVALALAAGIVSPAVGAAASARLTAAPGAPGSFGVRLVDVPVSEANDPRAFRYIVDYLPVGTVIHRRILVLNRESRTERFSVYPDAARISGGQFIGYAGATRNELTRWISVQHPTVTLVSGITTATATAAIRLSALESGQAGLFGKPWFWVGLGSLVLLLVAMAQYALRHRRRHVPARHGIARPS
jgi:hypothetical protein